MSVPEKLREKAAEYRRLAAEAESEGRRETLEELAKAADRQAEEAEGTQTS